MTLTRSYLFIYLLILHLRDPFLDVAMLWLYSLLYSPFKRQYAIFISSLSLSDSCFLPKPLPFSSLSHWLTQSLLAAVFWDCQVGHCSCFIRSFFRAFTARCNR